MHTVDVLVSAGAAVMVGGTITERNGKDISAATFELCLGGRDVPGNTWLVPNVSTQGATAAERIIKMLVNSSTPKGTYHLWARVTDNPEILPMVVPNYQIVVR